MTQTLTIRVARRADMAALDALYARAYPRLLRADYPPSVLVTAVPLISRAQPALIASGTYYVAETAEGALIGAGGWTPRNARTGEVRHVVTDDRAVRRGVGRAILNRVIDGASRDGLTGLECRSTRTAVPFYRALGFAVAGPINVTLRPGITFPAVQMYRQI